MSSAHDRRATARSYYPAAALRPSRFGLFPVRSPLLGESLLYFLFLGVLRCFSSPGSPPELVGIDGLLPPGLSHSEIPGSMVICTYPRLIAAYHVLHRLNEPRHPPCALSYFLSTLLPATTGRRRRPYFSCVRGLGSSWEPFTLQSCLCQYVKDLTSLRNRGEYRIRTDDLLHAMQAL